MKVYAGRDEAIIADITSWSAATGQWVAPSSPPTIRAFLSATPDGTTELDASVDITLDATTTTGRYGGILAGSALAALRDTGVTAAWLVVLINGTQWEEAERVRILPRLQR